MRARVGTDDVATARPGEEGNLFDVHFLEDMVDDHGELISGCIPIGEMERSRGTGASRGQWVRHEKSQLLGVTGATGVVQLDAGRQTVAQPVDGDRLDAGPRQVLSQA